jgi:ElaB/YqjD/DUF883 family membrane-anchored ribosome-binding protein
MGSTMTEAETEELREKMEALKRDFADVARLAKDRAVNGTTQWVKEHPVATIGIAAGIGLAIGLLIGRSRS